MPNKTIYVKDGKMWELAKKLAGKDGLSSVISDAISDFVLRKQREEQGFKKYRFEIGEVGIGPLLEVEDNKGESDYQRFGFTDRIAFVGRLLICKVLESPSHFADRRREMVANEFKVYRTQGNQFILTVDSGEMGFTYHYSVYTTFSQLRLDPVLLEANAVSRAEFFDALSEEIGEDWTVWIE